MGFTLKFWLVMALVYLESCNGTSGKKIKRTYTVKTVEDVDRAMQDFMKEICQKSSRADGGPTTATPKPQALTTVLQSTIPATTIPSSTLTTDGQSPQSTNALTPTTPIDTFNAPTAESTTVPITSSITGYTTSSSTSTAYAETTFFDSTQAPTATSYDSVTDTRSQFTTPVLIRRAKPTCDTICISGPTIYEKNSEGTNYWIGKAANVTESSTTIEIYCGCTCDDKISADQLGHEADFGCSYVLVQRRVDDSTDFNQEYEEYKKGFGDMTRNYWIGLEKLHLLLSAYNETYPRLSMLYNKGGRILESVSNVMIGDENTRYRIKFEPFSNEFWKSMNEMKFDVHSGNGNCGFVKSGWWGEGITEWCTPNSLYQSNGVRMDHQQITGGRGADFIEIRLYLLGANVLDDCPKNR